MIRVSIRVDGSAKIGMGHIVRCLSLAKEIRKSGHTVSFISRYKEGIEKIISEGFLVSQILNENNKNEHHEHSKDLSEMIPLLKQNSTQILIVDSYNVDEDYFQKLKAHVQKLCYIDDLNKFVYPVHMLINGNIGAEEIIYNKYSCEEIFLLGAKYNLIRDEFRDIPTRKTRNTVSEILITTGGGDQHNLSSILLNEILSDKDNDKLKINLIIGSAFNNQLQLQQIAANCKNVILHENVKYMSQIMMRTDVSISSGGSTLYELCACGVPSIAIIVADNQEFLVQKMQKAGLIESLGWYNKMKSGDLLHKINKFVNDKKLRDGMTKSAQILVDGNGTKRIVKELERMMLL